MALPRSRSYLGIAKETRPSAGGSPTPAAATNWIPYTSITPFDNITYLDDLGIRGSMVTEYGVIQGKKYSEFDLAGDVYADTFGFIVAGVLGSVTTTGASAPYTHAMTTLNAQASGAQPTTYTFSDYYSTGTTLRQYAGSQMASTDVKFSADALLTHTTKAMGFVSTTTTAAAPTFTTVTAVPSWEGTVTLNGTATSILADGNINIARTVNPIWTVSGDQNPYQLFAGPVAVSGSLMLVMESDTQLLYYLNNTQPALDISFTQGTGAGAQKIQFHMTQCAFTVGKIERSKDYVELNVTYKAVANQTDAGNPTGGLYSPIAVTFQNALGSGTYV